MSNEKMLSNKKMLIADIIVNAILFALFLTMTVLPAFIVVKCRGLAEYTYYSMVPYAWCIYGIGYVVVAGLLLVRLAQMRRKQRFASLQAGLTSLEGSISKLPEIEKTSEENKRILTQLQAIIALVRNELY